MKLIDCFMYFDEDIVLDIRLNTLNNYVNKFVIAEATLDHSGKPKKLNFKINNFSKFKDKINYIIVDNLPVDVSNYKKNWHPSHVRDQFQRNSLTRGYDNANDQDLIMISDIDEIPDPKKINEFKLENKYACFIQKNFQSKINQLNISSPNWPGTKICQKKYLKSPQWLRNLKTKKKNWWSIFRYKQPQIIFNGGWHFSFLKKPELIQKKIKSYAHQEFNKDEFTNIDKIKERIKLKKDIFDREYSYKKIKVDNSFPEYITNNKDKFKDWII